MSDRFEHLDRHDLVKLALDMPIVTMAYLDPVLQTGLGNSLLGQQQLLARNRDAGHATTGLPYRLHGKAAPTTADLQDMIVCGNPCFFNDRPELVALGLFEGLIRLVEEGTGIGHARVEEGGKEFIAQVVVLADIAIAPPDRIGSP